MTMTAKERQRMQRLEIENRELRQALEHHQDVNRRMLYKIVDLTIGLRVTEEQERDGLDSRSHGETAYNR